MSDAPAWMSAIPTTRLRLTLAPDRPWEASDRPEVTIRGALGRALFEEGCDREDRECRGCPRAETCPIPTWYDPGRIGRQAVRPFVVRAPRSDTADLHVELWFFGPIPDRDLLLRGVSRMARDGLGAERVPHRVARAEAAGETTAVVLADDAPADGWPAPAGLDRFARPIPATRPLMLDLVTPVQIEPVGRRPWPEELVRAAMLRVRSVARTLGVQIDRRWDLEAVRGRWSHARFAPNSRWSRRQEGVVDLSGWTGVVFLTHGVEEVADLLAAAEVLHVGGATSAGLGWFSVDRGERWSDPEAPERP